MKAKLTKASSKALEIREQTLKIIADISADENSDGFYTSEKIKLYSYYGSDSNECMAESNFESAFEALGGDIARKNKWIRKESGELSVHISQPFLVKKILELEDFLENEHPLLDDGDFFERERDSADETFKCYQSDFVQAIDSVLESHNLVPTDYTDKDKDLFARMILEEDMGYRGLDDAFVDEKSILRPMQSHFTCSLESHLQKHSKLYRHLNKKIKAMKAGAK